MTDETKKAADQFLLDYIILASKVATEQRKVAAEQRVDIERLSVLNDTARVVAGHIMKTTPAM